MKRSILTVAAFAAFGFIGGCAAGQPSAPKSAAAPSAMNHMGDMKAMMAKMPPEMMMRCRMIMNTAVMPSDPAAILALKDQLKLSGAQVSQLEATLKDSQAKAAAVLTADQQKTLDALPKSPQTMKDMHEQMMGKMQKMMGDKMGDKPMNCPMMKMMKTMHSPTEPTTQPETGTPDAMPPM